MTTHAAVTPNLGRAGQFVHDTVVRVQHGYLADHPSAVSQLARLRRGVGRRPEEVPDLWGLTADESLYSGADATSEGTLPAERAAYAALTLYAVHQQSQRERRMHVRGCGLGAAVRQLMPPGAMDEPIRKRFVQAGAAPTVEITTQRLSELVPLLRRQAIPLDYGHLADQLVAAHDPAGRERVRRAWGRGFHAYRSPKADGESGESDAAAPPAPSDAS